MIHLLWEIQIIKERTLVETLIHMKLFFLKSIDSIKFFLFPFSYGAIYNI